jgi:hypothetical protein
MMSSGANRSLVVALLNERQNPRENLDCAKQMARLYPGGVVRLEQAWHAWIVAGARATNGPSARPATRATRP